MLCDRFSSKILLALLGRLIIAILSTASKPYRRGGVGAFPFNYSTVDLNWGERVAAEAIQPTSWELAVEPLKVVNGSIRIVNKPPSIQSRAKEAI